MKKTQIISASIMLLISAGFLFLSSQNKITSQTLGIYDAFDTYSEITIAAKENGGDILEKCREYLYEADGLWSFENPQSEISRLNSAAGGEPVSLSDKTIDILDKSIKYFFDTSGYFDITVGALSRLWDIGGENPRVPTGEELSEVIHNVGSGMIVLDKNAKTASLSRPGMSVTLGAIAKGYAAADIAGILKEEKISSALINLGGNIYAIGRQPDSKPWNIGIKDPAGDGVIGTLEISDMSVVTSGSYLRYFEEDGKKYHHILNPFTGMPANSGLLSATVISPDPVAADALSTACFVIGYEESLPLLREAGAYAIFVTDDNTVRYSKELEGIFSHDNTSYEYKTF